MISRDLTLALLSLDAYNREYDQNLIVAGDSLGKFSLISRESQGIGQQEFSSWQSTGFYAIAYDVSGADITGLSGTVISYRGTNANWDAPDVTDFLDRPLVKDALTGWIVGAGIPGGQANLAIDFYKAVAGGVNPFLSDITTTGHSLGGGLAGYVATLYGNDGVLFDHMPYALAVDAAFKASANPANDSQQQLRDRIYGMGNIIPASSNDLEAFATTGEVLGSIRTGDILANPEQNIFYGVSVDGVDSNGDRRNPVDLHSQALLVNLIWARDNVSDDWEAVAPQLWDAYFSEEVAGTLASDIEQFRGPLGTDVSTLQSAIAYSAIDEGERPFGDVAIRSMFNDAADLGKTIELLPSRGGSIGYGSALSELLVEFAGLMALRDVEADQLSANDPNVLGGILEILSEEGPSEVPAALRVNFGNDLWSVGGQFHEAGGKQGLIDDLINASFTSDGSDRDDLEQWYSNEAKPGIDLLKSIDEVVFSLQEGLIFRPVDGLPGLGLQVGTTSTESFSYADEGDHFLFAERGDDNVTGNIGIDILYGGIGDDTLNGGGGKDWLSGGTGQDTLDGGSEADYLDGGQNTDVVRGGGGDDTIIANRDGATDSYDGGEDDDIIVFQWNDGVSTIDLSATVAADQLAEGFGLEIRFASVVDFGNDDLVSLERAAIEAGRDVDTLVIAADADIGLVDYIDLGATPSNNFDLIDISARNEGLIVNLGEENLIFDDGVQLTIRNADAVLGGDGDDQITGNAGANRIEGGQGADILTGGAGNDSIYSNLKQDPSDNDGKTDILDGGAGRDFLYVNGADEVANIDPLDLIFFNRFLLEGGVLDADRNVYIGSREEEYTLSGEILEVKYNDETIVIKDFVNGDGGINLRDEDPEDDPNRFDPTDFFKRSLSSLLNRLFGPYFTNRDPLVLDLNLGDVSLRSLALSDAFFDLDSNNFVERTGWIQPGEGLLAFDANGNGIIDNGSELFGTPTVDGFTILAQYDSNSDNQITSADGIWDQLLIWRDDGDGISTAGELSNITQEDIVSIDLNDVAPRRFERTRAGNSILGISSFAGEDGFDREVVAVGFSTDTSNSLFVIPDGFQFDPDVFTLPNLRGYGDLPDLWTAMSLDPVLKQMVQDFMAGDYESIDELNGRSFAKSGPGRYLRGVFRPGPTTYHYEASAFDDILARWAGVAINGGIFDERQAELTAEKFLGRAIVDQTLISGVGPGRGAGNPVFHRTFARFSTELVTRFVAGWADIEQNRGSLDRFRNIIAAVGEQTELPEATVLQQLIDQTLIDAENTPELSPFLQRYAALRYDFGADEISGDIAGFIDAELQSFAFNADNPWDGWTNWVRERSDILGVIDRDGSLLDERRRAYTGNQTLPILLSTRSLFNGTAIPGFNEITGDDGDNVLQGAIEAGLNGIGPDLIDGGAGDDVLMGGIGSDAYVFADGSGNDIVIDAAGEADEVAFQGSLFSTLAVLEFVGNDNRDLKISFEGRDETVLIKGYFADDGTASIERISFADGPLLSERFVRDAAAARLATDGDDRITGTRLSETIVGGAGNDNLGFNFNDVFDARRFSFAGDVFVGGAGDDILQGADGNDVFRFSRGDGHDIVDDYSGLSTIEFDDTIAPEDVVIRPAENGEDIILTVVGEDQSITLIQFLEDGRSVPGRFTSASPTFNIVFADGTVLTEGQILSLATAGTSGDDVLFSNHSGSTLSGVEGNDRLSGKESNDILIGGAGDDILTGNGTTLSDRGNDEYRFSRGDGHDIVNNENDGRSTIRFDATINPGDISVTHGADGNSITLFVAGEDQSIIITDFLSKVDETSIGFIDGTIWTGREILSRSIENNGGDNVFFAPTAGGELSGGEGNDILEGRNGQDTLSGDGGNDRLLGNFGEDLLDGGDGNDELIGGGSDDILIGGAGDDLLDGVFGNNIYRFSRDDGHDVVRFARAGIGNDVIEFDSTISIADIGAVAAPNGRDLIVTIIDSDQSITLSDALINPDHAASMIRFIDGSELTVDDLLTQMLVSTNDNDLIVGTYRGDLLDGGAGDDELRGGAADDVIVGGTGNDILSGGDGNNIFRFNLGDGQDTIVAGDDRRFFSPAFQDVVEFGPGLSADDISVTASPDGQLLTLSFAGLDDSLSIERNAKVLSTNGELRFADGSILNASDIFELGIGATLGDDFLFASPEGSTLEGLAGNDQLTGSDNVDVLDGGEGNDTLIGGGAVDVYRFNKGDGQDTIIDQTEEQPPEVLVSVFDSNGDFIASSIVSEISAANSFLSENGVDPFINAGSFDLGTVFFESPGFENLESLDVIASVGGFVGDGSYVERGFGGEGAPRVGNRIEFGPDIDPNDVYITRDDFPSFDNATLQISGTDDTISIQNQFGGGEIFRPEIDASRFVIDEVVFSDGTIWSAEDIADRVVTTRIEEGTIVGGAGDDIIDTRGEYFRIEGNGGSDTFIFERGYGSLTIDQLNSNPNAELSVLEFGAEISPDQVLVTKNLAGDIELQIGDDKVVLANALVPGGGTILTEPDSLPQNRKRTPPSTPFAGVAEVRFANGTVWTNEDLLAEFFTGSESRTTLIGDEYGVDFDPMGFAREIFSRGNEDTIIYNQGYGQVSINLDQILVDNGRVTSFRFNEIIFGPGLSLETAAVYVDASSSLVIDFGNGDKVRLVDAVTADGDGGPFSLSQNFRFSDGSVGGDEVVFGGDELVVAIGDTIDFSAVLALANEQMISAGLRPESGLQEATFFGDTGGSETFDPNGIVRKIVTGGGNDTVHYKRGYGKVEVDAFIPTTGRGSIPISADPRGAIPLVVELGPELSRENLNIQEFADGFVLFDFGEGDQLKIPNPFASELLYPDGAVAILFSDGGVWAREEFLARIDTNFDPTTDQNQIAAAFQELSSTGDVDSQFVLSGVASFVDNNIDDLHEITVSSVSISGPLSGVLDDSDALSFLSLDASQDVDEANRGYRWFFVAGSDRFEALAQNETSTIEYSIEIDDGRGGVLSQTISVNVTGSNDTPVFVGGVTAANIMPSDLSGAVEGEILFSETDLSDSHTAQITDVEIQGNAPELPSADIIRQWLTLAEVSPDDLENAQPNSIDWNFTATGFDFSGLASDEFVRLSYTVEITDSAGDILTQPVVVSIGGATAAPGALFALNNPPTPEDTAVDLELPASAFVNVLDGDLAFTARLTSGENLPDWLAFDGSRFTGTPPEDFNGNLSIIVTATNATASASDVFTLVIEAVDDAPVVQSIIRDLSVESNSIVDFTVPTDAFLDADGDELTLTATLANGDPLPDWLGFDGIRFLGTAPEGVTGSFDIEIVASDGALSASQIVRLGVGLSNNAPSILVELLENQFDEDTFVDVAIPADSFEDIDGDTLSLSASLLDGSPLPDWLSFDGERVTGTPPANFNGSLEIAVTASDGELTNSQTFALTILPVNDAPVQVVGLQDAEGIKGEPFSFDLPSNLFEDIDGDTLTLTATLANGDPLPAWLIFDGASFSGQAPLSVDAGEIEIRVSASDGQAQTSDVFSLIVVEANSAPEISVPIGNQSSNEDQPIDLIVPANTFTDIDGDLLSLSATLLDGSALPAWLVFDGTGFTGTPPQDFNGTIDLTVTASDGSLEVSDNFTLTIDPVNDAPVLSLMMSDQTSLEDEPIDFLVPADTFADVDGDSLTLSATLADGSDLPAWLSFDGARFAGQPPQDFNGMIEIALTASDGELEASDLFALSITPVNDPPVILTPLADVSSAEDSQVDVAVPTDTFVDVDGDPLTLTATLSDGSDLPAWLTFDGIRLTGTPPQNFNGNIDIAVTASDGELDIVDHFTLTIDPVNDAPVVLNAIADINADEDTVVNVALPTNIFSDIDGDALTLSAALVNGSELPIWLSFDGVRFTGMPPANFNGSLDIRVIANDGELQVSNDFALTIDPVNDAPILTAVLSDVSSDEDTSFDVALPQDAFADVEGDALTLTAALVGGDILPDWISFDGERFTGTPPQDFNGVLDIEVTASDGQLGTASSFALTIDPINDAPIAVDDDIFLSEGGDELTILQSSLLDNDSDVDGDTLSVVSVTDGTNGTVGFDADGNIVYTPNAGFQGEDSFTYTISDGELTSTATAQLRVDDPFSGWRQGTEGNDFLFGNFFRANEIFGRAGNDYIFGGFRADYLAGGDGDDRVFGLFGNDHLWGNAGDDKLYGGFGTDTAYFNGTSSEYELQTQFGGFYVRTRDEDPTVNGDDGRDQLYSIERLAFSDQTISVASPIILDLDGDGTEVVSAAQSNALFDLDADGVLDDTSWIGSGDAFLFLDRNGDGFVSGVNEISFVDDAEEARSDLDGLRAFDSNGDTIFSAADDRFVEFGVWQDLNTNGAVDAGETFTLQDAGIESIDLNATATESGFTLGDVAIVNQGTFTRADGSTGGFADAAITFFQKGVPELPVIDFSSEAFRRKSKKYRIYAQDGELMIGSKKGVTQALDGASVLNFKNRDIGMLSPIVLDLDGDGIELRKYKKSKARFDMDGDGSRDNVGWTGKGDGFLVIDRNNNGLIDNGTELSFLTEAPGAKSDLQALSALDSNGDGIVSSLDVRFRELKVWVDRNDNGLTDAGELATLDHHGIASVSLDRRATNERVKVGNNILLATSSFTRTDGTTGAVGDAVLAFKPAGSAASKIQYSNGRSSLQHWKREGYLAVASEFEPDDAQLMGLRDGLRDQNAATGQGLRFDAPKDANVFDYFEKPANSGAQTASAADASASNTLSSNNGAVTETIVAKEVIGLSADIVAKESVATADPDLLKLALMTQDMNVFGASSGATMMKERERTAPMMDYFVG
ncbi:putative Ig domain-containing protein [Sphingorhabdus sp. Alg231-15]|uniref:putative Ig domain-containing protein n=1 Tax=Sphingorhabdus sp. Alg231-15 TaxID=1922222 RepID=UPI000D552EE6